MVTRVIPRISSYVRTSSRLRANLDTAALSATFRVNLPNNPNGPTESHSRNRLVDRKVGRSPAVRLPRILRDLFARYLNLIERTFRTDLIEPQHCFCRFHPIVNNWPAPTRGPSQASFLILSFSQMDRQGAVTPSLA